MMKKPKLTLNNESHFSFRVSDNHKAYLKKLWTPPKDNNVDTIV